MATTTQPPQPDEAEFDDHTPTSQVDHLASDPAKSDQSESANSPSGRRRWLFIAVLAVAAVGAYFVFANTVSTSDDDDAVVITAVNTAPVLRTDLVEEVTFDGTLRTISEDTITTNTSGVVTALATEGDVLVEGDIVYAVDDVAVPLLYGDAAFYRDLSLGGTQITIEAPTGGTITSTSSLGSIVEQGDVLYSFEGEPVTVLYGEIAAYRDLYYPELEETTTVSTLASDTQTAQSRQALIDAIPDAEEALADARAETPSAALLNAIDALTIVEQAGGTDQEFSLAHQAVAAAQQADLARIDLATEALAGAEQAVVDFDAVQASAAIDEVANTAVAERDPNLIGPDVAQLETALAEMGYDLDGSLVIDDEFTYETSLAVAQWQTAIGVEADGIIDLDDVVFVPGPSQIVDLVEPGRSVTPGTQIAVLSTGEPLTGSDVAQLEQALERLGFDADGAMVVDDSYTAETRTAVLDWQHATGQSLDGVVSPSDIVITSDAFLVTDQATSLGAQASVGQPLLDTASIEQVVNFDLPADDQSIAEVGDTVTITLPDVSTVPGTLTHISTKATVTPEGDTVLEATVTLDDPTAAGDLNEAPVDVNVVGTAVSDVLAVPVSALIALAEGGYAVEVAVGDTYQLVAVEPGFFADGLVEVDSSMLAIDDMVTLP